MSKLNWLSVLIGILLAKFALPPLMRVIGNA